RPTIYSFASFFHLGIYTHTSRHGEVMFDIDSDFSRLITTVMLLHEPLIALVFAVMTCKYIRMS
ncbi:MAG TPA: hypothetical protein VFJ51_04710, partial [Nitrososphaeraceae archaeon]|nr:hypothetical protein [Nitrososphaeraceae archaeon]